MGLNLILQARSDGYCIVHLVFPEANDFYGSIKGKRRSFFNVIALNIMCMLGEGLGLHCSYKEKYES